ncbi:MAG: hypothetical protein LBQ44_05050 [Treponema sp.]|nr:hypothetical protein [Treponema sp.]
MMKCGGRTAALFILCAGMVGGCVSGPGAVRSVLTKIDDAREGDHDSPEKAFQVEFSGGTETSGPIVLRTGENSPAFVTLDGRGGTLKLRGLGSLLTVGPGLTLELRNITLRGREKNTASLVRVMEGGRLILGRGALITGNETSSSGGGVYVAGGSLILEGGEIRENRVVGTRAGGGGVYGEGSGAALILRNGAISDNGVSAVRGGGGGVYLIGNGVEFTMTGGEIRGNSVSVTGPVVSGGGVHLVGNGARFVMRSGVIRDNRIASSASASGGGVYLGLGDFIMTGGRISGNGLWFSAASVAGGGVHVNNGNFTLSGGYLVDNTASKGGGVYITNGAFTSEAPAEQRARGASRQDAGGDGAENSVAGRGAERSAGPEGAGNGEKLAIKNGSLVLSGGEITGNNASIGGGVYLERGLFIMNAGRIRSNTALLSGGGVHAERGTFTRLGGDLGGNAGKNGPDLYP